LAGRDFSRPCWVELISGGTAASSSTDQSGVFAGSRYGSRDWVPCRRTQKSGATEFGIQARRFRHTGTRRKAMGIQQIIVERCFWKILVLICICITSAPFAGAQESPKVLDFPHATVNDGDTNGKITIRSVLNITGATRRPVIEIWVYSDAPFEGGNDTHVLHIGSKKFGWPRAGDTKGRVFVFELTPKEFANLKNGDEVKVTYGLDEEFPDKGIGQRRVRKYGKLDKSKINQ
jgi:hypothetical protein